MELTMTLLAAVLFAALTMTHPAKVAVRIRRR